MSYNLFLDDIRIPADAAKYVNPSLLRPYYNEYEWVVVRSYDEFVKHIVENGMPHVVSFDHDLADEHYTPEEYWGDYEASKAYQEGKLYKEKTGYDCAKWMIDFSKAYFVSLPKLIICHSMNPVGYDNIMSLFRRM